MICHRLIAPYRVSTPRPMDTTESEETLQTRKMPVQMRLVNLSLKKKKNCKIVCPLCIYYLIVTVFGLYFWINSRLVVVTVSAVLVVFYDVISFSSLR